MQNELPYDLIKPILVSGSQRVFYKTGYGPDVTGNNNKMTMKSRQFCAQGGDEKCMNFDKDFSQCKDGMVTFEFKNGTYDNNKASCSDGPDRNWYEMKDYLSFWTSFAPQMP